MTTFAVLPSIFLPPLVNASSESSSCQELLNQTGCQCVSWGSGGPIQIQCELKERQDVVEAMEKIHSMSLGVIDKVAVRECGRAVEVLEPLPKMKVGFLKCFHDKKRKDV
jgi:hypothetical protein